MVNIPKQTSAQALLSFSSRAQLPDICQILGIQHQGIGIFTTFFLPWYTIFLCLPVEFASGTSRKTHNKLQCHILLLFSRAFCAINCYKLDFLSKLEAFC